MALTIKRDFIPPAQAIATGIAKNPSYQQVQAPGGVGSSYVQKSKAEQARDASLDALTRIAGGMGARSSSSSSSSTGTGVAGTTTPVSAPPVAPGAVPPPVAPPNDQAAMDAALLRAKEKQGQIATSSLTGLREALGDRQMLGSGVEGMATADIANAAAGNLSDLNVEQLKQSDENARRLAELTYSGGITQRGQDIGANTTYRGQDVTMRGQDLSASSAAGQLQLAQQNAILQALRSLVY